MTSPVAVAASPWVSDRLRPPTSCSRTHPLTFWPKSTADRPGASSVNDTAGRYSTVRTGGAGEVVRRSRSYAGPSTSTDGTPTPRSESPGSDHVGRDRARSIDSPSIRSAATIEPVANSQAPSVVTVSASARSDDLELEQRSDRIAERVGLAVVPDPTAIPAVAQEHPDDVPAGVQERGDVVGLVGEVRPIAGVAGRQLRVPHAGCR